MADMKREPPVFTISWRSENGKRIVETFEDLHLFKRRVVYLQDTGIIPEDDYKDFCTI
jgi:hypothetical protein